MDIFSGYVWTIAYYLTGYDDFFSWKNTFKLLVLIVGVF